MMTWAKMGRNSRAVSKKVVLLSSPINNGGIMGGLFDRLRTSPGPSLARERRRVERPFQ